MRARALLVMMVLLSGFAAVALSLHAGVPRAAAQPPPEPPAPPSIPVRPRPPVPPPPPVRLDRMNVAVAIGEQVAATTMDLVFRNPGDRPEEATLLFPVPAGAAISDFTMTVDGQTLEGEILGSEEAARIYTSIVQRRRDPALLEYVGLSVLRARVFPVPPRGESRLTLRFSQLVGPENTTVRYRLPLSTGEDAGGTLAQFTISARVTSERGVRDLFSPTHAMRVSRVSETEMTAAHEATNVAPRGTFELDALLSGEDVAAGIISYRAAGEDGFFMLWLAPPLRPEAVVEKDVVLVLDVSGSMAGRKIEQAKAALRSVLGRLNPGDRFSVVAFSSGAESFAPDLRPAAEAAGAIAFVDRLRAEGGTNMNEALLTALALVDSERLTTVLFLTDGEPTVGERDPARILDNVRAAAPANSRLFVFGVGNDVNAVLLSGLAVQNHGSDVYVRPDEDVEEAVATLYSRISSPQLTDLRLDFGGARVYDVYPQPLPDLFAGGTLFVVGRYRTPAAVTLRLTGNTRAGPQEFVFPDLRLAENDRQASYLPRLWASRKVGALLREIRLRGESRSRELIDEVIALGRRYGIVTPYTSFLVQEPQPPGAPPWPAPVRTPVPVPAAGAPAVAQAAGAAALAQAAPAPTPNAVATPAAMRPGAAAPEPGAEVRYIGDKAFVLQAGVWVDTEFQAGAETVKVPFAGDEYFALLAQKPELGPYFALGERVVVVLDGVAYEVTE